MIKKGGMVMNILLIEDNEDLSKAIIKGLEKDYTMDYSYSYLEGINKAKRLSYDLILLDIMLSDGNGLDFIKEIKQYSDIPIILLSVINEDRTIVQGLDLGADDYLTKPFRIEVLKARIQSCIRRYRPQNNVIKCKELLIDLIKRKVYKNNQEVILTSQEANIFFALVKADGRVLTREYIIETFWDQDNKYIEDNTLSQTMRRLKSKIGKEYILTKYNVGYYFNGQ